MIYFVMMLWVLVCIAFASAFAILLLGKWGVRDVVAAKAPKLISELFSCDLCLSFWVSCILAIILAIFFREISILFIPILSTPITRLLI